MSNVITMEQIRAGLLNIHLQNEVHKMNGLTVEQVAEQNLKDVSVQLKSLVPMLKPLIGTLDESDLDELTGTFIDQYIDKTLNEINLGIVIIKSNNENVVEEIGLDAKFAIDLLEASKATLDQSKKEAIDLIKSFAKGKEEVKYS